MKTKLLLTIVLLGIVVQGQTTDRLYTDGRFSDHASTICSNGHRSREQGIKYRCPVVESAMLPEAFAPKYAHAQQTDKPAAVAPVPIVYRLTPEESVAYAEVLRKKEAVVNEANRQLRELDKDAQLILADAGIPKAERDRKLTPEGDHFVLYPKTPLPAAKKETP